MTPRKTATALRNEIEALVDDDRAFDIRVVRGALDFINRGPTARMEGAYPELAREVFGWIPGVLERRAVGAGIPQDSVKWTSFAVNDAARAITFLLMLVFTPSVGFKRPDIAANPDNSTITAFGKQQTGREWFDEVLSTLPIYSRFVTEGTTVRRREVALINSVPRALAYALAVLLEGRWQLRGRVRACPYTRHGVHFFLDHRTDKKGRLLPGEPQKYCCPAHSNAHRQQLWRDAQRETR